MKVKKEIPEKYKHTLRCDTETLQNLKKIADEKGQKQYYAIKQVIAEYIVINKIN